MEVKQIYELVNSITGEVTGKTDLVKEDLSNIIDVGTELFKATDVDNYVKSLVNRVGKTIFTNTKYSGRVPSVVLDNWEFGSVLQKISADIPVAEENESWELTDRQTYDPNVFYKPSISVKFFNSRVTFEVPLSFTERQVKESFGGSSELNAFLSMLYNSVEKSMTVKIDSLVMRTINNMIAHTYNANKAVNLLALYNDSTGDVLTSDKAMYSSEFIRFATMQIALYSDRLGTMSTLFNVGGKERFTSKNDLRTVLLSDFVQSSKVYLKSDLFNPEYVNSLQNADAVPYWQGSGENYDFADVSKINVTIKDGTTTKDVAVSGILGVIFDKNALGVSNLDRRVTTNYNPKAEFFSNWYKFDAGYFNDLNENFIAFYIAD